MIQRDAANVLAVLYRSEEWERERQSHVDLLSNEGADGTRYRLQPEELNRAIELLEERRLVTVTRPDGWQSIPVATVRFEKAWITAEGRSAHERRSRIVENEEDPPPLPAPTSTAALRARVIRELATSLEPKKGAWGVETKALLNRLGDVDMKTLRDALEILAHQEFVQLHSTKESSGPDVTLTPKGRLHAEEQAGMQPTFSTHNRPDPETDRGNTVFLMWSGAGSHDVAKAFGEVLDLVFGGMIKVFISTEIKKGMRWHDQVAAALRSSCYGVACIVPNNATSPWINYEAGAVSNVVDDARVSALLVDVDASGLPGTLGQFQATRFDEDEVRSLLLEISEAAGREQNYELVHKRLRSLWDSFENKVRSRDRSSEPRDADTTAQRGTSEIRALGCLAWQFGGSAHHADVASQLDTSPLDVLHSFGRLESAGFVELAREGYWSVTQSGREELERR